jgi:CubicO group peptidase (beta-lactamase class C family)
MLDTVNTLKSDTPEHVGMNPAILEKASALLQSEIEAKRITAAALLVARRGAIVLNRGFGNLHPAEGSLPTEPDSIFLLASITKPVTACSLMLLVERGQVSLNDPVSLYIPEFQGGDRKKVQVRHLLSHTSGLPDMLPNNIDLRREHAPLSAFVQGACETPLLYTPNTDFAYQSKGILLAAEIIERVANQRLRDFEAQEIFTPLGMHKSALGMGSFTIPETVWCSTSIEETKDEKRFGPNSPYWRDMGHPWGGMHSTTGDLAILLQTMLNGGTYEGKRLFSSACVETMTTDQNPFLNAPWGLGWGLANARVWNDFGELASPTTFGHTGATGTVAWADPTRQLICVLLTNHRVDNGSLLRRVSNLVTFAVAD